ncbi:MAG: NAD(P)-dependent oxidoreductase [Actinomycetota bacterium]|nr:NAD(P)-dependent oxidoreductase [Actinomycetota bacterium]
MTRVGVVGLGAMGSRIATRFLDAGHEVAVWNRTSEKAQSLVDRGAVAARTPAEAAGRVDVVMTMVAHPKALEEVTRGRDGIAHADPPTPTVIEMSTVGPDAIRRLRDTLPAQVELLDAPVLGSTSEVEAGNLTVFLGAADDSARRWTPLLTTLGEVVHVGPLGSGAAAKLVANSTLLAALTAVGEAVLLGDALGLRRDRIFEVLSGTPLAAQAERRRATIEKNDYPLRFALALAHKDADLILEAAAGAGVDLHVAEAARAWFIEAEKAGLGQDDYSSVLAHILGSFTKGES